VSARERPVHFARGFFALLGTGAYLAKDNLVTDLIPAVAAATGIPPAADLGTS